MKEFENIIDENELLDFYEKLMNIIANKYDLFFRKFGVYPSFVKIPEIFYLKLYQYQEFYKMHYADTFNCDFEFKEIYTLSVCSTVAINSFEEIEVF